MAQVHRHLLAAAGALLPQVVGGHADGGQGGGRRLAHPQRRRVEGVAAAQGDFARGYRALAADGHQFIEAGEGRGIRNIGHGMFLEKGWQDGAGRPWPQPCENSGAPANGSSVVSTVPVDDSVSTSVRVPGRKAALVTVLPR